MAYLLKALLVGIDKQASAGTNPEHWVCLCPRYPSSVPSLSFRLLLLARVLQARGLSEAAKATGHHFKLCLGSVTVVLIMVPLMEQLPVGAHA